MASDGDSASISKKGPHAFSGVRIGIREYTQEPDIETLSRTVAHGEEIVTYREGRETARFAWNAKERGYVWIPRTYDRPALAKTKPGAVVAVRRVG